MNAALTFQGNIFIYPKILLVYKKDRLLPTHKIINKNEAIPKFFNIAYDDCYFPFFCD